MAGRPERTSVVADLDPLPYRTDQGTALIELRLNSLAQLFNVFDPSPFHRKDLDRDAEDYIVGALRELGPRPARLVLHLPGAEAATAEAQELGAAIRNFFAFQAQITARDLRLELRRGRDSWRSASSSSAPACCCASSPSPLEPARSSPFWPRAC